MRANTLLPPEGLGTGFCPCRALFFAPPHAGEVTITRKTLLLSAAVTVAAMSGCQGTGRSSPEAVADARPPEVHPFEGITVLRDQPAVEIEAWTCLESGWLEQIACSPNSREHESLVVVAAKPSDIHAALLMAGFQPGSPGRWMYEEDELRIVPPAGDRLDIFVRYRRAGTTEEIEEPIANWIRDAEGRATFPDDPWVFGGSSFTENPEWMGPGEHYVADMSGSIIGLVTFGDEVVGYSQVLSDQAAIQPPQWEVRSDHLPAVGTPVILILRPAGSERQ